MKKLSMRKYAAQIGVSVEIVSRAVRSKCIVKGYSKAAKKINVKEANEEWGFLYLNKDDHTHHHGKSINHLRKHKNAAVTTK